jgi:hypothetical protein
MGSPIISIRTWPRPRPRAEAATERRFDRLLAGIPFPAPLASTVRALIGANQRRAALTGKQARSVSLARLVSFTGRPRAADAAVEAQVRILRRALDVRRQKTAALLLQPVTCS